MKNVILSDNFFCSKWYQRALMWTVDTPRPEDPNRINGQGNRQRWQRRAHINEQGQWPSKAATKQLQLDSAGGNCLPLVNNSTYHRRILDWKTQRRTHPAPLARINKNTFEWRCPLSVLPVPHGCPLPCSALQSIEKVFMFISRWVGSASTWTATQATLFKWKPRAHFKSKLSAREGCLRFELCIWLWLSVAASCSLSTLPLFKL